MPMVHPENAGCRSPDRALPHASASGLEGPQDSSRHDLPVRVQQGGALSTTLAKTQNYYLHHTTRSDVADGSAPTHLYDRAIQMAVDGAARARL